MKKQRWLLVGVSVLVFLFCFLVVPSSSAEGEVYEQVKQVKNGTEFLEAVNEVGISKAKIEITEDIFVPSTVAMSNGQDITVSSIDGQQYEMRLEGAWNISNSSLTTLNVKLTFTNDVPENMDKTGISILHNSTFDVEQGTIIHVEGKTNTSAIQVNHNSTMYMNGGSIQGNISPRYGGGIYLIDSTFIMNDGNIENNTIYGTAGNSGGGGLCALRSKVYMNGGNIQNNHVEYGEGGGVYLTESEFYMTGGSINNNKTEHKINNAYGGGINSKASSLVLTGGEIIDNDAQAGGGIFLQYADGNANKYSTLTLDGTIIDNNRAPRGGGGIYVFKADVIFESGRITNNKSLGGNGGGILAYLGSLTINGGEISNNQATTGGGVYTYYGLTMTGGTIQENKASGNGGGIYVPTSVTTENLKINGNSKIVNNIAGGHGGGIFTEKYESLDTTNSTVFAGNSASVGYVPLEDADSTYPNIKYQSFTIPSHPINNYDINYVGSDSAEAYDMLVEVIDEIYRDKKLEGVKFILSYEKDGQTYYYSEQINSDGTSNFYWSIDKDNAYILVSDETGRLTVKDVYDQGKYMFTQQEDYPRYKAIEEKTFTFEKDETGVYQIEATPIYIVTYYSDDTIYQQDDNIEYGTQIDIIDGPTKDGYIFIGWSLTNGGEVDKRYTPNSKFVIENNLDLYAIWLSEEEIKTIEPSEEILENYKNAVATKTSDDTSSLEILVIALMVTGLLIISLNSKMKKG